MNWSKRAIFAIGALAALSPIGTLSVEARVVETAATAAGAGTPIDWAIDVAVRKRVAAEKLSTADARIAREQLQLQFQSLSAAEQQKILASARTVSSEEGAAAVVQMLNASATSAARQSLADAQSAAQGALASGQSQRTQLKLGPVDTDLIFIATPGPCRVFDSRNGPGPLAPASARQIFGFSDVAGYNWAADQGGTGTAGSGNCVGTVYSGTGPASVVATVTVVNTTSAGSLQAWNGGTTLTVGAALAWNGGDRLANTTVIPMNRFIAPFAGSGAKRDFGLFNNSPNSIDIVVDVLGYFIQNKATALDCTVVADSGFDLAPGTTILRTAPSCPAGFTAIMGQPATGFFGVYTGTITQSSCRINNTTGGTVSGLRCDALCCRVPGL